MEYLKNAAVYGSICDIGIEEGKIAFIGKTDEDGTDLCGMRVYPGLVDVHSHGCIGYDTMDAEDHLREMAEFQLSNGTTTWYPTTMTMSFDDITRAVTRKTDFENGANIPGFHMEGPFINPKHKGAQSEKHIFKPDYSKIRELNSVKIVTIAPELPGSRRFIEECPALICLGHSDADYDTARGAFRAGVRCLTHTFNAMPGIHHRMPGPIAAAFDTDGIYAQIIADGNHIHESVLRMIIRILGEERIVLISDSMRATGMEDGEYTLGGEAVFVKGGVARCEDGRLAGSTSTLLDCVRYLAAHGISADSAFRMASEVPARMMGLNKGKIEVGYDADLIAVDNDNNLVKVMKNGRFYK